MLSLLAYSPYHHGIASNCLDTHLFVKCVDDIVFETPIPGAVLLSACVNAVGRRCGSGTRGFTQRVVHGMRKFTRCHHRLVREST